MPRILKTESAMKSSHPPSVAAIYDRTLRDRGNVPNMFRTMAHRPEIFETIIAHMDAVLNTGTLPKALKELIIVLRTPAAAQPHALLRLASHTAICKAPRLDRRATRSSEGLTSQH